MVKDQKAVFGISYSLICTLCQKPPLCLLDTSQLRSSGQVWRTTHALNILVAVNNQYVINSYSPPPRTSLKTVHYFKHNYAGNPSFLTYFSLRTCLQLQHTFMHSTLQTEVVLHIFPIIFLFISTFFFQNFHKNHLMHSKLIIRHTPKRWTNVKQLN